MTQEIKGLIFDLDGVIVDTAKYHFLAWRKMANQLGIDFDHEQNEKLKGVSRKESLELILSWGQKSISEAEKEKMMALKNEWYLAHIYNMAADEVMAGADVFIREAKKNDYKIALGSASKNAILILDKLELTPLFDALIDGNIAKQSKPNPEVFAKGAEALGLQPAACVVFEDAQAGIAAAHNAGMLAVGLGDAAVLREADLVLASLENMSVADVLSKINKK